MYLTPFPFNSQLTQDYPLDILRHACKHGYKDLADIVAPNTLSYQLGVVAPKLTTILYHWVRSVSLRSIQLLKRSVSPNRWYITTSGWVFAETWIVISGSPNPWIVVGLLCGKPYLIANSPKILVSYFPLFHFPSFHHAQYPALVPVTHFQNSSPHLPPKDVQFQNSVRSYFLHQVEVRLFFSYMLIVRFTPSKAINENGNNVFQNSLSSSSHQFTRTIEYILTKFHVY